jgi:hypothetical protein
VPREKGAFSTLFQQLSSNVIFLQRLRCVALAWVTYRLQVCGQFFASSTPAKPAESALAHRRCATTVERSNSASSASSGAAATRARTRCAAAIGSLAASATSFFSIKTPTDDQIVGPNAWIESGSLRHYAGLPFCRRLLNRRLRRSILPYRRHRRPVLPLVPTNKAGACGCRWRPRLAWRCRRGGRRA